MLDDVFNVLEGQDGHDWPENFFCHQWRLEIRLEHDSWLHMLILNEGFSATDNFTARALDETLDALSVELIDHLAHVRSALAWLLDDNLVPEVLDLVNEGLYMVLMDKDVVWCDADLPRVRDLAHADLGR